MSIHTFQKGQCLSNFSSIPQLHPSAPSISIHALEKNTARVDTLEEEKASMHRQDTYMLIYAMLNTVHTMLRTHLNTIAGSMIQVTSKEISK